MNLQIIFSYLDIGFFLVLGIAGTCFADRLVKTGSEEERRKKIRVVRIACAVLLIIAVGRVILKFA